MSNSEQPIVSVASNNRIGSHNTLIIAIIPTTIVTVAILVAIWNALPLIAYAALGLLGLYLAGLGFIDLRKRWYHGPILAGNEHGHLNARTGQHLPALPPPSVQVSEVKDEQPIDRVKQAMDILEAFSHGSSYRSIAKSYKDVGDTYWTEHRVRQITERAKPPEKSRAKVRDETGESA